MYEKQSRNTNRSTDTIASFLLKTYQILQHPEYQRIISWDQSGVGFIIHDVVLFTREILPKYFRHSNFSSFVRQLNMYDFHKVKQQNDILLFKNPLFCKGQQQNLKFIRRKATKKNTGQKRTYFSSKNDIENEKFQNLLKGFKKSFEIEINQSSVFYEKSLQVIKDINDSNLKKKLYIKDIYGEQQKIDTTEEIRNVPQEIKKYKEEAPLPKKDTIIQIPKQFLQYSQAQQSKAQPRIETMQKQTSKLLNIQNIILLKEEVYNSLGSYELWLQEYIETQRKKLKYINGYRQQFIKCREEKLNENNGNYDQQEGKEQNQNSNSKQNQQPDIDDSRLDNQSPTQRKVKMQDSESDGYLNQKKAKIFQPVQKLNSNNKQENQVTPFKNQSFQSLIQSQTPFTPRLFSAFSKSKNYQQSQQQEDQQKYQHQNDFIDKKIQTINDRQQNHKNRIEGSF